MRLQKEQNRDVKRLLNSYCIGQELSQDYDFERHERDTIYDLYLLLGQKFPDTYDKILNETISSGLLFITDRDARASTGAHPVSHLWDNGVVIADELNRMMTVRRKVLDDFSDRSLPSGEPYSSLEETTLATEVTLSSFFSAMSLTPCVLRPV